MFPPRYVYALLHLRYVNTKPKTALLLSWKFAHCAVMYIHVGRLPAGRVYTVTLTIFILFEVATAESNKTQHVCLRKLKVTRAGLTGYS